MKLKLSEAILNEAIKVTKSEMGQSADNVYNLRKKDIEKQIKVLPKALKTIDALQKKNPKDWGYSASLGKIKEDLEDIIYFMNDQR